ncbi:methionine-R-sulfoxide reductase B2 [Xylaria bambusicola]|uniref:methionine-R-sulfoxide reductase B2 n=1 Tax=Xylaria bambusicola TaxID=326684 RepID=UPI00200848F5|nr:methionine-R-sulfoxide reductase B2 [Xylaria bambusicola]KAI0514913.1 methionine-R-sulfoxide reductase B2 [Xylaria bambusicola]
MRLPPFATLLRTVYTFSSLTRVRASAPAHKFLPQNSPYSGYLAAMPFSSLFGSSSSANKMTYPDERSPDEWRAVLSKEQFRILREKGTEAPGSHKFDKFFAESGVYTCAGCNAPLYMASQKFKSGCGWPAYFDNIPGAVTRHVDRSWGMSRTEIVCSNCGGHLGHVFKGEGYPTPTDERHCVNGVSLNFSPNDPVVETAAEGAKDSKA